MKDRIYSTSHSDETGHPSVALELDEISAVICEQCRTITWVRDGSPLDGELGIALACGDFDVVEVLPAVGAPAQRVVVTRPTSKSGREFVDALPAGVWLRAMASLWFSPSNGVLLLATSERHAIAG